ncbi:hypothetical protein FB446DRAFT_656354 [Lentinula raphanica]|nr:hypothetical protein FB446DRAFT_656354 [Lentinula raphanica]
MNKIQNYIPDMPLEHDISRSLVTNPKLTQNTLSVILNEAHCISQWHDKFRPIHQRLGMLRVFVPVKVLSLATLATTQSLVLASSPKFLHIDPISSFHINVYEPLIGQTLHGSFIGGKLQNLTL